jgi:hypothetical protein
VAHFTESLFAGIAIGSLISFFSYAFLWCCATVFPWWDAVKHNLTTLECIGIGLVIGILLQSQVG